jgi:hypothetical protein
VHLVGHGSIIEELSAIRREVHRVKGAHENSVRTDAAKGAVKAAASLGGNGKPDMYEQDQLLPMGEALLGSADETIDELDALLEQVSHEFESSSFGLLLNRALLVRISLVAIFSCPGANKNSGRRSAFRCRCCEIRVIGLLRGQQWGPVCVR